MRKKKYTVIGAGNGGLVTAGYIFLKGYEVSLYNRSEERIKYIKEHDYTIQFGDKSDKIRSNFLCQSIILVSYF